MERNRNCSWSRYNQIRVNKGVPIYATRAYKYMKVGKQLYAAAALPLEKKPSVSFE
jgi:hypothetical protein